MVGMSNVSYQEKDSGLSGPNVIEASSGSVANISGLINYRFKNFGRWSSVGQFLFPLIGGTGTYLAAGIAMEYYWGQVNSKLSIDDQSTNFSLTPITRFFAFGDLNIGYLSYQTETAKRQDTLLEIGAGGGISRRISKYNLRAQVSIGRGTGVTTDSMAMKLMLGGTFFLD